MRNRSVGLSAVWVDGRGDKDCGGGEIRINKKI